MTVLKTIIVDKEDRQQKNNLMFGSSASSAKQVIVLAGKFCKQHPPEELRNQNLKKAAITEYFYDRKKEKGKGKRERKNTQTTPFENTTNPISLGCLTGEIH